MPMKVAVFSTKPYDQQFFDLANKDAYHLINAQAIRQAKPGVMLINTSRGAPTS